MSNVSVFRTLHGAGLIPSELLRLAGRARMLKEIPVDVAEILTEEQCNTLAAGRHTLCTEFQRELESFYRKHYQRPHTDRRTLREIELADVAVSHNANSTLWYVAKLIREHTAKVGLAHISKLPTDFEGIYALYTGRTDVDVRGYFPTLFPDAPPIEERELPTGKQV